MLPQLDPKAKVTVIAQGIAASPGAACGKIILSAEEAVAHALAHPGDSILLVRSLPFAATIIALAWALPAWYEKQALFGVMLALAVRPILIALQNPTLYVLYRRLNYKTPFYLDTLQTLAAVPATILFALYFENEWGLVLGDVKPSIDMARVNARRTKVVTGLTKGVEFLFKKNKLDWIKGSALVGMQPQLRQVPPSEGWRSTTADLRPSCEARIAATYPPVPAPITTTSYSCATPVLPDSPTREVR